MDLPGQQEQSRQYQYEICHRPTMGQLRPNVFFVVRNLSSMDEDVADTVEHTKRTISPRMIAL